MTVRVVTAGEAAERDRAAIERGTPSRELMRRAGDGAARLICHSFESRLHEGVAIFTGPGNNGGDGWVVARSLVAAGVPVTLVEAVAAKSADAIAAKGNAGKDIHSGPAPAKAGIVVDALLGTGAKGQPREEIAEAMRRIRDLKKDGAAVVSLDLPTGLDATTGAHEDSLVADMTITFGNVKRGQLLARDLCGEIVALDIGLGDPDADDRTPELIDHDWVASRVPPIRYDVHKGKRGKLAVVSGGPGMPGAAILVARAALRSGIGVLRMLVHESNLAAVANAVPSALVTTWPCDNATIDENVSGWADSIVAGPGLGRTSEARTLIERVLGATKQPVLIDADGLTVFAGDASALSSLLRDRKSLLTPHHVELGKLMGREADDILRDRFDVVIDAARELNSVVLLKGNPTIIADRDGRRLCSARGSAALASGGSGDMLSGIAGTLLAQMDDVAAAAGCAAWIHGRAAELCEYVRGTTLEDVLFALPRAWNEREVEIDPPVLARLPKVAS